MIPKGRWVTRRKSAKVHYLIDGAEKTLCGWGTHMDIDAEKYRPWDLNHPKTCPVCKRLYTIQLAVVRG